MTQPVILVLSDGLGDDAAHHHMRYMEGLVRARRAVRLVTRPAHESESRPNYETLHTGVSPAVHGITSDTTCHETTRPTTFDIAASAGLSTAAVTYSWAGHPNCGDPANRERASELFSADGPARHGCTYSRRDVADAEVFERAAGIVAEHHPHYTLINPMGIDATVHRNGADSCEYPQAVRNQDDILGELVPEWIAGGYAVIVTAGHGHRAEKGRDGGPHDVATPLYLAGARATVSVGPAVVDNERVAPTVWALLDLHGPADAARPLVRPVPRASQQPAQSRRPYPRLDDDALLRNLGLA